MSMDFPSSIFGNRSHGLASLPDYQENHFISVDSNMVIPLEFLSFP
jgi:hypothetical protein